MNHGTLITMRDLAHRWGKDPRTIKRCIERLEGFPKPIVLNGRLHWRIADIDAFERGATAA